MLVTSPLLSIVPGESFLGKMTGDSMVGIAIAMIIYFVAMILIGIWAYTKTSTMDDYMLGGRQLNPWVAALSAGAADMSGWLLMGLPGALYLTGVVNFWIAIGLTVGAWLNWMLVAPRLRSYTEIANNSITVPSFFSARLHDKSQVLSITTGMIIVIFFTIYVASGMVAGGRFFEGAFGMDYYLGMTIIAAVVVIYTLVGGFLAVSWTDMIQGLMMLGALLLVPIFGLYVIGGFGALGEGLSQADPNLLSWTGGGLTLANFYEILNGIVWGLGYFGMPHIIVRFMALKTVAQARQARRIGIGWMILSVVGAGFTALIGRVMTQRADIDFPDLTGKGSETVFLVMGQMLFWPFVAGFVLAAVLAAIMSTISSQLLVTSSAVVEDVYHAVTKKDMNENNRGVRMGRIVVLVVSVVAAIIAWAAENEATAAFGSSILEIVAFAWAGFGAAFGPLILLSLYWRKLTTQGALVGMIVGALTTVIWHFLPGDLAFAGGIFKIYEILPGFLINLILAVVVSLKTYKFDKTIDREFTQAVEASKLTMAQYRAGHDNPKPSPDAVIVPETHFEPETK